MFLDAFTESDHSAIKSVFNLGNLVRYDLDISSWKAASVKDVHGLCMAKGWKPSKESHDLYTGQLQEALAVRKPGDLDELEAIMLQCAKQARAKTHGRSMRYQDSQAIRDLIALRKQTHVRTLQSEISKRIHILRTAGKHNVWMCQRTANQDWQLFSIHAQRKPTC